VGKEAKNDPHKASRILMGLEQVMRTKTPQTVGLL